MALAMSAGLVACSADESPSGAPASSASAAPTNHAAGTTSVETATTGSTKASPGTTTPGTTTPGTTTPGTTTPGTTPGTAGAPDHLPLAAPDGDAFYVPPDPIPGAADGDIIWARALDGAPAGTSAWQVLYRSESVAGAPIAVSGVVVAPATAAGPSRPVLTWAHGTTGLGDDCAPSKRFTTGTDSLLAAAVVALGFTYVATDYEGLGTPGVHPYLVGVSEGRGVLDIVRAAAQLTGTGVDAGSPVAIVGHSQGGHAALMAGELAATYAPELHVVGTAAAAPPGDLGLIEQGTSVAGESLTGGFGLMMDAGFASAYPDLPANALVTDEGVGVLAEVGSVCTTEAFRIAGDSPGIQRDGTLDPDWEAVFETNSPGHVAPSAPVLIIHGSADVIVPPALSAMVESDYCDLGVTVQRTVYDGADHTSVLTQGFAEIQSWIGDRLAGKPAPSSC